MTDLALALWAASISGTLREMFFVMGVITLLISSIGYAITFAIINEDHEEGEPWSLPPTFVKYTIIGSAALLIVGAILPSSTTVKQMVGVTYAEKLLTHPDIRQLADPATALVKEYLEQELKNLRKKAE